jgi:5,10-methylene-tetrahydrofolate dehydrogenase/methenyl tetrahydrofolate cyclohydrolase
MSHDIIDGKAYAQTILDDARARVAVLREAGWQPRLVSITVGNNPAAAL